jgi:hypothetical protein
VDGCVKLWGEKMEEALALTRPLPTAMDEVISQQDVQLLQFAYSDVFEWTGGSIMGSLFKKFAMIFSPALNSGSLRHATLAFATAFIPPAVFDEDRLEYHSNQACKVFLTKTPATLDESDLFAAFLLTFLACIYGDLFRFGVHLNGFLAILKEMQSRSRNDREASRLGIFWPLTLDLILEGSRRVCGSNDLVIEFCFLSQQLLGPQNFIRRAKYTLELFGKEAKGDFAFLQAVWQHSAILRRCFRDTVLRQLHGETGINPLANSVVSEAKADLNSQEIMTVVFDLFTRRSQHGHGTCNDINHNLMMFMLLLHQFCRLLIHLLESETIIQHGISAEGTLLAQGVIQLVQPEWLLPDVESNPFPLYHARAFLPRMLWIVGLILTRKDHPEGTPPPPLFPSVHINISCCSCGLDCRST